MVQGLAEAQANLGNDVHVVTSCFGSAGRPVDELYNGVSIHRLKCKRFKYPDLTLPVEPPIRLLKSADIIHVHGHNSLFCQKILQAAVEQSVKTACYFMAVDAFSDHPNWLVRYVAPFYGRSSTRKALKKTDLVLVKSFRDLNVLKSNYGINATYLPDAVNTKLLLSEQVGLNFKEKFGINQKIFFLYIGRIHKLKGPHILVKALKYLPETVAVVFIGPDDGYMKELNGVIDKLCVRERTYILGFVDEQSKMAAIDSSVALVLPSIANYVEVYPGVISEAWARRKPVIASNVGGIPYRLRDHINGLLIEPSNPIKLAEAMSQLTSNDVLAREMGINGRSEVLSWEDIAKKSLNLYAQSLNGTPGAIDT